MNEVHFFGGNNIFGYDGCFMDGDAITTLVSTSELKPKLSIGTEVVIQGNSRGYVPGNIQEGAARVVALRKPFIGSNSDCIVQVLDSAGIVGWVKPSNVILP